MLCDFHRLQAWGRWLRGHRANGHFLSSAQQEHVLSLWKAIARSASDEEEQENIDIMKADPLWNNDRVKQYMTETWLPVKQVRHVSFSPVTFPP